MKIFRGRPSVPFSSPRIMKVAKISLRDDRASRYMPPKRKLIARNLKEAACPRCGAASPRCRTAKRRLTDLGDHSTGRTVRILCRFSVHRCPVCQKHFAADLSDLAFPGSAYTRRVVDLALCYVRDDGLTYRDAARRLREEHLVSVPFSTIPKWAKAFDTEADGTCRIAQR